MTIQQLQKLKDEGKIKGFTCTKAPVNPIPNTSSVKKLGWKNKQWMHMLLEGIAKAHDLMLVTEFHFHPTRKFRFDWALTSKDRKIMIGIEYNGLMSEKSRHTTVVGYSRDMEKLNLAQAAGWKVFQFTTLTYEKLFDTIVDCLNGK